MPHRFGLVFLANHKGYAANEAVGFPLDEPPALVSAGICRIADDEAERDVLEAAGGTCRPRGTFLLPEVRVPVREVARSQTVDTLTSGMDDVSERDLSN